MKKINYLSVLLVTMVIALSFNSCSDDDESVSITEENVIGVWEHLGEYGWDGEYYENFNDKDDEDGFRLQYLVIYESGRFARYIGEGDDEEFYWDSPETGRWDLEESQIEFFYDKSYYGSQVREIVKLTSSSMELKSVRNSVEDEEYYEVDVYKRTSESVLEDILGNR